MPHPPTQKTAPAVFLDRDDTLIRCNDITPDGDLGDPSLVQLLPTTLEACKSLADNGLKLIVISNQGGVARGKYPTEAVDAVNARLNDLLGGLIEGFWYCPWHPKGTVPEYTREHPWRKPAPGMLLDAADKLDLDLPMSWMVGDAPRDCQAGRAAGTRTILLSPEPPPHDNLLADPQARHAIDFVAPDLAAAARIILEHRDP